jgi:ketosteroid isomerase-like protein
MISDEDVAALLRALETEQRAWIAGKFNTGFGFEQADDMTIFGPFGGPPPRMPPAELAARQSRAATQFEDGSGSLEIVNTIVSSDVAILVLIERSAVRLTGHDEAQPWVLRTTSVFRRDDERGWIRLHRHADPLIRFRPGDATFSLARA